MAYAGESETTTKPSGGIWRLVRKLTRQELTAVAIPYCLGACVFLILIMYCVEKEMMAFTYSPLPESKKTPGWFQTCLVLEVIILFSSLMSASLTVQLHILFPMKMNTILNGLEAWGDEYNHPVKVLIHDTRCIQLLVNLFNMGHKNVVYFIKLYSIAGATINGYAAVKYHGENPMFGVMTFCIFGNLVFMYGFMYEKAFAIPDGLINAKRNVRLRIQMYGRQRMTVKMAKMQVESVRAVGIKVGDFHTMERASTPMFIDYVIRNVVSLLVTL